MSNTVVKSGWLQRQKYFTKKWKLYWFVLYKNGSFRYFTNEQASHCKDDIFMPTECTLIKVGRQVHAKPHEMLSPDFLISIDTRTGKTWTLSGESLDDTVAWQTALIQAQRTATPVAVHGPQYHSPYYATSYQYVDPYRTVIYPTHGYRQVACVPTYSAAAVPTYYTGSTTVVYPGTYHHGHRGYSRYDHYNGHYTRHYRY